MVATVIYMFNPTPHLLEWLDKSRSELAGCLRGRSLWLASESDLSEQTLPTTLAKVKILYYAHLLQSWDGLLASLPPGSNVSIQSFDKLWETERLEVDGAVAELLLKVEKRGFPEVQLTEDAELNRWIRDLGRQESDGE